LPDLLAIFHPNADQLLRCVSACVDDAMLHEIAAADYGDAADRHFSHLLKLRSQGSCETPMDWHPREVLELIRWSEPDDPAWKPGSPGDRGHWMRAFACSALLKAAAEDSNEELRQGWNSTLIQLIDSLRAVGPELYETAASFLAWLILRVEANEDVAEQGFLMLGLLWLALHFKEPIPDRVVVELCEQISREAHQSVWDPTPGAERWLLGATFFNLRHKKWEQLGLDLTEMDLSGRSSLARDWVRLIGGELAGKQAP